MDLSFTIRSWKEFFSHVYYENLIELVVKFTNLQGPLTWFSCFLVFFFFLTLRLVHDEAPPVLRLSFRISFLHTDSQISFRLWTLLSSDSLYFPVYLSVLGAVTYLVTSPKLWILEELLIF